MVRHSKLGPFTCGAPAFTLSLIARVSKWSQHPYFVFHTDVQYKKREIEYYITIPFRATLSIEIWIFIVAFLKHTLPLAQLLFSFILYREKLQAPRRLQRGWDRATISQGSI